MHNPHHQHLHEDMLSVEEAKDRILQHCNVLHAEEVFALNSLGQTLAKDIVSELNIPPLTNSAMDGYAVISRDLRGASTNCPVELQIIGSLAAGDVPKVCVTSGTTVRIMTGAPIPEGADAIVPFEDTDEVDRRLRNNDLSRIGVKLEIEPEAYVRPAGQDVKIGERVLRKGISLRPAAIGMLSSIGHNTVTVIRRPIISILSTGDELLEPGDSYTTGKIYDSNSYGVAAAVLEAGGVPKNLGIANDNIESVTAKIQAGLSSDMIITSAGVSKGDYDMIKEVLANHGQIDFWSVRMKPAKPLAFGLLDAGQNRQVPHIGLPGNPVSALIAFEQFAKPAIHKMMGKLDRPKPTIKAILDQPIHNTDGRRVYARVIVTRKDNVIHARLTGHQGSNILTSMVQANGLAICPETVQNINAGDLVDVQMLDWPEDIVSW